MRQIRSSTHFLVSRDKAVEKSANNNRMNKGQHSLPGKQRQRNRGFSRQQIGQTRGSTHILESRDSNRDWQVANGTNERWHSQPGK